MGHPTCIIEGLACWLTLCILEKIICNSTNSVQISFIETLKLIVFSWTIWWCYWQNVLMINEKNNFLTVSWLSGLLSAEIFISTGEWGVQMPPLTSENSYFLWSGPQGATLVMPRVGTSGAQPAATVTAAVPQPWAHTSQPLRGGPPPAARRSGRGGRAERYVYFTNGTGAATNLREFQALQLIVLAAFGVVD